MTRKPRKKSGSTSGATSGISKTVCQNSRCSSGDLVKLHKKPDECRKQLEQAFLKKVKMLPSGEMAILMILPHAKNGPLRVQSNNLTMEQVAGMLDALDKRLPFSQQRLRRWVEKAMEKAMKAMKRRRRRKQLPAGEGTCGRHLHTAPLESWTA